MEERGDLQSIAAQEYAERFPYYNRRRWNISASKGPSEIVSLLWDHEQQREGLYVFPQQALRDAYTSANFSDRLQEVMRAGVCDRLVSVDGPSDRLLVIHTGLLRQLDASRQPPVSEGENKGEDDVQASRLGPYPYPVSPGDEFTRQQMSFFGAAERAGVDTDMTGDTLQRTVLRHRYLASLETVVERLPAISVDVEQFGYYNHEKQAPWEPTFLNTLGHRSTKAIEALLAHPDRPKQLCETPYTTLNELGEQYSDADALQETLLSALSFDEPELSLSTREARFFVEDILHNRASGALLHLEFETLQQIAELLRDEANLDHPTESRKAFAPLSAIPRHLREIGAQRLSNVIGGLRRDVSEQLLHETRYREPFHDIRSYETIHAFVIFLTLQIEDTAPPDGVLADLLQRTRDLSNRYVRLLTEQSSIAWGIPQNGYPEAGDDLEVSPPMILSATEQTHEYGGRHAVLLYSVSESRVPDESPATPERGDSDE